MTLEAYVHGFGCVPNPTPYELARCVVIPVPLEWGAAEVPGVGLGPLAILGASRFLETFDASLGLDPLDAGVATLDGLALDYSAAERPIEQIAARLSTVARDGKRPLCLGGDRTIVLGAARGEAETLGPIGVVLLSRRPGLLEHVDGRRVAPATVGRRLGEAFPCCVLGPRWWSAEEARVLEATGAVVLPARRVMTDPVGAVEEASSGLPRRVHLSIDVGVLDPACLPMPGNFEPGGLGWFDLVDLVDAVFARCEVVGCDVSGFAPVLGSVGPSLTVAQLVLHCLGRLGAGA